MTKEEVIDELLDNPDYKENLGEILHIFFEQNPKSLKEWKNWFKDLN